MSPLLDLIPPTAVYCRAPLDAHANALEAFQEAVARFAIPENDYPRWRKLADGTQLAATQIEPALRGFAEKILRQNADCIEALDRGLDRGKLQFDEFHSLEQVTAETDFVAQLGEVARLRLIRYQLWFSAGDLVAAGEELFRLDKIGSMVRQGEGQILHYLVGLWLCAAAIRGYGRLAANTLTPKPVLKRMLATLDTDFQTPDGLAQSLRVDLATIALAQLDRTLEGPALESVVDRLFEVYYVPRLSLEAKLHGREHAAIAQGWLEERRRQILFLLSDHPKPFDKAATARLMGVIVAETIRDLNLARKPSLLEFVPQLHSLRRKMRFHRLGRKTRFWPVELTPGMRIEAAADIGLQREKEGRMTTIQLPTGNLNESRLAALRAKLRGVENPIGLMLAELVMSQDYSPHLFDHLRMMKTMRKLIMQRLALDANEPG